MNINQPLPMTVSQCREINRLLGERFVSPFLVKTARRETLSQQEATLVIQAMHKAPYRVQDPKSVRSLRA